ncbi:MAG TPA: spore germination protein GerW family protein [bacterium]|nr:spore germination protein GerW family protein [bacterium]
MLEEMLNRIGQIHERAAVKTVFGEPYQVNGRTVIPVAKVCYGFGCGAGRGNAKINGGNESGGGGGGVSVRPVAVLEVSGTETRLKPIVDVTRLAIAGMALLAWNAFWITYTVRRVSAKRPAERAPAARGDDDRPRGR